MGLLDDFRIDIGDDDGVIPSGSLPSGISPLPPLAQPTLLSDLRVDTGDDDGLIPSGIVQGVALHNLLSSVHPDTSPASPVAGDLIVGGGTWSKLARGTSGQFLTVTGSTLGWTSIQPIISGIAIALIAVHASDPDAHHARYTDAEAIAAASGALGHHPRYTDAEASGVASGLILIHAADPGVHHTRYTDGEAIAAASGALDHHSRYTDAEASGVASGLILIHAADPGVHHQRYTDAEAISAVLPLIPSGVPDAAILQESGVELTANATTTAVFPVPATLLSTSINLLIPSGNIRINATAAINASGPVPIIFHVYIDGVFYRGTTVNVTGAIDNASIVIPRVAVTGSNPHTVSLRWMKFGSPAVTVFCLPIASPDFYHASLSVQEVQ